jgi:NAD(P)-dependent dehydrogenase (short-subunit alcohol dehydrogenase family)
MRTALIIGASRGIGRELVRQYLADGWQVIATARNEADVASLAAAGAKAWRVDVTRPASIAALAWNLDGELLDVAFLNAGVYGPREDGVVSEAQFDEVMHTNVLAAIHVLPVIAPMVAAVKGKLAVLSSRMGSLGARDGNYGSLYRASKAALNSVLVDTSIAFGPQGATCVAFHPGWVQTDMGGAGADITPEQSASGLRATLARATPRENGSFLNYDGTPIPW